MLPGLQGGCCYRRQSGAPHLRQARIWSKRRQQQDELRQAKKEETVIQDKEEESKKKKKKELQTYPARFLEDNGIRLSTDEDGRVHAELSPIMREPQRSENVEVNKQEEERQQPTPSMPIRSNKKKSKLPRAARKKQKLVESKTKEATKATNLSNDGSQDLSDHDMETAEIQKYFEEKQLESGQILLGEAKIKTKTKKPLNAIFKRTPKKESLREQPATVVPTSGFNVVLTHCTADFDSLASAVGLAKLWASSSPTENGNDVDQDISNGNTAVKKDFDSSSDVPTFVVLPRGAHPGVQRFLALHKHLFPIRSLRSLPDDLTGLNRLGLVDAQRRDRIGPAENLLQYANRVTVVDHHIDSDTDIPEATDYVVDQVGSVSTLIAERLQQADLDLTEAEATLLALGIHADTGSLCYDSTTPRDAMALAWVMSQGASQAAIAEHAQSSLSNEQQGVLTQALINTNSTVVHGVTVSTVLLSADGFINGLAAVTQDALELSSSDIFLLAMVYEAQSGGRRRSKGTNASSTKKRREGERLTSRLLSRIEDNSQNSKLQLKTLQALAPSPKELNNSSLHHAGPPNAMQNYTSREMEQAQSTFAEAWRGGEDAIKRKRLQAAFDRVDLDASGYLEPNELAATLAASGIIASDESIRHLMETIDTNGDGKVDFDEFIKFAIDAERRREEGYSKGGSRASTMIIIGRVKAGVNMKSVKLNKMLEKFGGGGHAKAASATIRLNNEYEAEGILQGLVDEIIETSLQEQLTVGDFMTAPVLSVKPQMTEKQVEDLFTRYDVRALPVVDDESQVIGLVTYKEVAAAKQRLWNKEQKRLRREKELAEKGEQMSEEEIKAKEGQRKSGSTVKGWMKQHVRVVEDTTTMAELEAILLESDVGCIPVVAKGTMLLIGMVTRTDLLRQHRYYSSLHYHNKGFADSISARKPIIELRKRLKKFDLENE